MLTTSRRSRIRLAFGAATIAGLGVAGLGLTASGSVARTMQQVTQHIDVDVDRSTLPASEGKPAVKRRHVVVVKDGKRAEYDGDAADAYIAAHPEMLPPPPPPRAPMAPAAPPRVPAVALVPPAPPMPPVPLSSSRAEVSVDGRPVSADTIIADNMSKVRIIADSIRTETCRHDSGNNHYVIHRAENGRDITVICTNRIQQVAADASARAVDARGMERTAYTQALAGLLDARTRMVADAGMNDTERTHALSAIDTSIAEMRSQIARMN